MPPNQIDSKQSRPKMPTVHATEVSNHTLARTRLLMEMHEGDAVEWAKDHVQPERLQGWGRLDISVNPLADYARQLSSPGHYGTPPTTGHPSRRAHQLIRRGGLLDSAGLWTRMQWVHYMTLGLGDFMLCPEVVDGSLVFRNVNPADVYVEHHPASASILMQLWELRRRMLRPAPGKDPELLYAWDVWDLRDPDDPVMRVHLATEDGGLGADVSNQIPGMDGPLYGSGYVWRWEDGRPWIPHQRYTAWDTGETWNSWLQRGAYWGTLNAILYRTYTGRAALDASGSMIITAGIIPPAARVEGYGRPGNTHMIPYSPGMWAACQVDGDQQPFLAQVGPGANLPNLADFSGSYESRIGARFGLNTGETTRASANPWSAAALYVTESDKRRESERSGPIFQRADLQMIRKVARLCQLTGLGAYPVDDRYSQAYAQLPEAPEVRRERREGLEWQMAQGVASPVDAYLAEHPGVTREVARAEIIRARVEAALLERDVSAAMEEIAEQAGPGMAGGSGGEKAQDTALNGAQVQAAQGIVESVAAGRLPRETGVAMLVEFFRIPPIVAERLMGPVGRDFEPQGLQSAPPPPTPPEPEPPEDEPDQED